jgi:RHS repeat-associated protein
VWQSWGTGGYNFANQPFYDTNTYTSPSMFRFYSMGLGRWLSPDPFGPDVTNPQSLNAYPYALNNPTSLEDPLGLQPCPVGATEFAPGQCKGDTGSWPQFWGGNTQETFNGFNAPNCIVDSLETNCGELWSNLHGSATLLFEAAVGQGLANSTWSGTIWSNAPATQYTVNGIPDPIQFGLSTPTFLVGETTPDMFAGFTTEVGNGPQQGHEIETLVRGLNALTTPLQNVAVSGGLFLTGGAVVAVGAASTAYVCARAGPLGCAAFAMFGGVPTVAGGVAIIYTGWQYTRQVTLPSIVDLFR